MGASARSRREIFRSIQPGPRARLAARLYASGAVKTKREACLAVGLSPNYLTVLSQNETITRVQDEVESAISDQTISLSKAISLMSREALRKVRTLIQSGNEHVALKASSDVLDRNPETSKTFKATVTHFTLDAADAKELAEALVAGARVKQEFSHLAVGDFVKVEELTDGQAETGPRKNGAQADHGSVKDQEAKRDPESHPAAEAARPEYEILDSGLEP